MIGWSALDWGRRGRIAAVDTADDRGLTDDAVYAAWRRGEVNPAALTMALDYRGLYGPQVDRACGVEEPAVDQWEAGALYPRWEQLQALAVLTRFPVQIFVQPVAPQRGGFVCIRGGRGKGCHPLPVHDGSVVFDVAVVAQCPGTHVYRGEESSPGT